MDRKRVVPLALSEHGGRERRLVGRIRKMLGLQTKSIALLIDFAVLSSKRTVQIVCCVELNSRLGRPDFHRAPGSVRTATFRTSRCHTQP